MSFAIYTDGCSNLPGELLLCPHEPFTGSHVGPGMLAVFFFGKGR